MFTNLIDHKICARVAGKLDCWIMLQLREMNKRSFSVTRSSAS